MYKDAHNFSAMYEEMGLDLRSLGCLMIDTDKPYGSITLDEGDEYYSPDPKKFWMKGLLTNWHVTARYGLMGYVRRSHIDTVLDGFELPAQLTVADYEVFPSPYEDEKYECLVARVDDPNLRAINSQLSVLPNLNTFVEYKPHITVGYFRKGWWEDNWDQFHFAGITVDVKGLNYGHMLP